VTNVRRRKWRHREKRNPAVLRRGEDFDKWIDANIISVPKPMVERKLPDDRAAGIHREDASFRRYV
jgi:hypothetical protein